MAYHYWICEKEHGTTAMVEGKQIDDYSILMAKKKMFGYLRSTGDDNSTKSPMNNY